MVKSRHKDNSLQAEDILLRMEQMHRSGNPHVRPNSYAYRYEMIHIYIVVHVSHSFTFTIVLFVRFLLFSPKPAWY